MSETANENYCAGLWVGDLLVIAKPNINRRFLGVTI